MSESTEYEFKLEGMLRALRAENERLQLAINLQRDMYKAEIVEKEKRIKEIEIIGSTSIEPTACAFKDAAGRDCLAWSQNEALAHGQDGTMRPLYEYAETEETIVRKLDAMAVESLSPEIFEKWQEVFKTLCNTRKNLKFTAPFDGDLFIERLKELK